MYLIVKHQFKKKKIDSKTFLFLIVKIIETINSGFCRTIQSTKVYFFIKSYRGNSKKQNLQTDT